MSDEPTTTKPVEKKEETSLLAQFLKATGYRSDDVLAYDTRRRVFVTSNGGKYQITKAGRVRRLSGPPYPKEEVEG